MPRFCAENGLVYSWGGNDLGQLGHGTVKPVDRPTLIHFEEKIAHIAAGSKHSIAISEAGNLYTWGGGWAGQLGDEVTAINNSTPKKLVTTDLQWKEAYGGENCSFAITSALHQTPYLFGHLLTLKHNFYCR
jgi:alpha-tubulin suppressor-like RCC1 family protein